MPATVNVTLSQGDNTTRTWQITSNHTALDLTSATVTAVIKRDQHVDDDDPTAHRITTDTGLTITDPAQGKVKVRIPTQVTAYPGAWYYKIVLQAGDDTEPAICGWITIEDT
ncbi:BppU family phage baseplate upper protein [Streptosporangium sandarakinum]